MFARRGTTAESQDCCCINIYVNNNVQGVNNSVLLGSEVRMRDPGVCLYFGDIKFDRRWPQQSQSNNSSNFEFCVIFLLLFISLFLMLSFI
ncbi:hypothetical protein Patl1_01688 [Pistacia atlantica]|uniref:Uncharacterized protein n=1 Tax=Pistacia atlantica TaxID=434234 RepID=A0ACC1CCP0_9ROSI|nr:hypothetical protein Patl1_01688 [Pistacia atlantica]